MDSKIEQKHKNIKLLNEYVEQIEDTLSWIKHNLDELKASIKED